MQRSQRARATSKRQPAEQTETVQSGSARDATLATFLESNAAIVAALSDLRAEVHDIGEAIGRQILTYREQQNRDVSRVAARAEEIFDIVRVDRAQINEILERLAELAGQNRDYEYQLREALETVVARSLPLSPEAQPVPERAQLVREAESIATAQLASTSSAGSSLSYMDPDWLVHTVGMTSRSLGARLQELLDGEPVVLTPEERDEILGIFDVVAQPYMEAGGRAAASARIMRHGLSARLIRTSDN